MVVGLCRLTYPTWGFRQIIAPKVPFLKGGYVILPWTVTPTWRIIPGLGYVVSNHGDRFRPLRIGLWDPLQMACSWLINGGDPNYLLTGMILQV